LGYNFIEYHDLDYENFSLFGDTWRRQGGGAKMSGGARLSGGARENGGPRVNGGARENGGARVAAPE